MKKRDLIFAGAMLLGFGLNAQAQTAEETLFFFGFEDGLASFTDSSNPIDSITEIHYFDAPAGNGSGSAVMPSSFDVVYVKDSTMLLLNGISPLTSRGDSYEIITDELGGHQAEMEAMGAQGGEKYFKYISGGEGSDLCYDYQANLFIRGAKLEPYTSYRLVFYTKASDENSQVNAGIFRGYYNSEDPISLNGGSGNDFYLSKTSFTTDSWERNTLMMFYQNDSVANRHMFNQGYWWSDAWKTTDPETGNQYDKIEQFNKFFFRISFMYPGRVYYLDDISLYKSTIGGAEFNGDLLRVNFGYETNLGAIAKADPAGAVELPGEYFTLTAEYGGDPYELDVMSAEYHEDGYLYIWLNDDSFEGLENVRLSLKNPKDPALQLKYTGTLFPNSLDEEWVNAGKIVPDFENEFAVYNPEVFAVSRLYIAPVMEYSSPENGSFNLDENTQTIDVTFSKDVYANLEKGTKDDYNVILRMKSSKAEEIWTPSAYDEETFTVTFKRPAGGAPLSGDCDFTVMNARAGSGDQFQPSDPQSFSLSFGDLGDNKPKYFYQSEPVWTGADHASQCIPLGWTAIDATIGEAGKVGTGETESGDYSRMYFFAAGGAFTRGFYTSPRNGSIDGVIRYGDVENYSLTLEPGDYRLSFCTFGWDGTPTSSVYFYPVGQERPSTPIGKVTSEPQVAYTDANTGKYKVTDYTEAKIDFTITEAGSYVMEFVTPRSNAWGGFVLGNVELTNQYSSAFKYLQMLEDAQAAADAQLASAEADPKYSGENLDEFKATINEYKNFKDTAPSAYENATKALKDGTSAMGDRMGLVDKYYTEYSAAEAKEAVYTDSTGYNQLEAYKALVAKIAEYKDLDVTAKNNEALTAITAEVTAATKAMTDRCAAIDKFNGLKADLENLFENYADYDFADEFKNAQAAYNKDKDLDLIAATDDDLNTANTAFEAAKNAFNSKMNAAGILTRQDKALKGLAAELEAEVDPAVEEAMKTLLDDRQDIANIYQLAIKAKLSEMMAGDELDEELDMTHFIQNSFFYNVYSPDTKITGNDNPLPGWTVLGGNGNCYLSAWGNNRAQSEGAVADIDIALDWFSGVKMTQTIKNLPAGVYTIGHTASAWGSLTASSTGVGMILNQKNEAGEIIAADTLTLYNNDHSIQFTALGGEVEMLLDWSTTSTWAFLDNLSLTLNEPLAGFDYTAAAAAAAADLEAATTRVASVMEAVDVKYYNLNGVRTAQPDGVSIKVTTGKNGARKVEKILVK